MKPSQIVIGQKYWCISPCGRAAIYIVEDIMRIAGVCRVRRVLGGKRVATQSSDKYVWKCRCVKGYIPNSTVGFRSIQKFISKVK